MDVTARGKVVKGASGALALDIAPNQSFDIEPNDVSRELESLTAQRTAVTVRGQLYKKPAGKKKQKPDASAPLRLLILEVQKRE